MLSRPVSLVKSEKVCGIYGIRRIGTEKAYVGQSIDCYGRYYTHRTALLRSKHESQPLQRAWNKYGGDAFEFVIFESGLDPSDKATITAAEQRWIDRFGYYNIRLAAYSNAGIKHSELTRRKISAARRKIIAENPDAIAKMRAGLQVYLDSLSDEERQKTLGYWRGKPAPMKGRHFSGRALENILVARAARRGLPSGRKGIPHTEEARRKMSVIKTGVHWWHTPEGRTYRAREKRAPEDTSGRVDIRGRTASAETKRKMSESRSGEKNPFFGRNHSEDTKNKMSISRKGRVTPKETRKKLSEAIAKSWLERRR